MRVLLCSILLNAVLALRENPEKEQLNAFGKAAYRRSAFHNS